MSARDGMSEHIAALREMCHAGTADYILATQTFWSDAHLQTVLDTTRAEHWRVPIQAIPELSGGTATVWKKYELPAVLGTWWERVAGGSDVWAITDGNDNVIGTATYSVDYPSRRVNFSSDQAGTAYYVTGRTYDLAKAAAAVWRRKAAYYAAAVDWATDGHRVNASQAAAHCIQMAEEFESQAGVGTVQMFRGDARRKPR